MRFDDSRDLGNVFDLAGPQKSNQEIVEGLLRHSPDAIQALYRQYGDLVNRLVWRQLGADQDHDDVVHQVFIDVISSIAGLANPLALHSWIAGVTINAVRKEIRSRKYRRILRLQPGSPETPDERLHPEHQLFLRRFYSIVDSMKTTHRIMFILRFVEGHTIVETAVMCGCSTATVKRKTAQAKRVFMKKARKDTVLASMIEERKHDG